MSGYIIDADPAIPTGIPATPEQVAQMLADGVLTQEQVDMLDPSQQPPGAAT